MDIGKGDWLICVNDTPCFHTGDRLTLHRVYQVREVFDGVDGEGPARGVRLEGQIRAIAPCGEEWGWNINYFRPSYFILEAEPEVSEFVKAFDLTVSDPQEGGMGEGEYRKDLLISGWNQGNEFGCSAMLKHPKRQEDVATLPSAMLHQVWKWNLGRKTLQEHIGNEQFVASVMFLRYENRTVSFATWIDAIPTVLPRVEMILIGRNKLARRRFLLKRNDIALASWEQANQAIQIEKYPAIGMGYSLKYDNPPAEIVEFVKGLTAYSDTLAGLPADQVLDRELVVKLSR